MLYLGKVINSRKVKVKAIMKKLAAIVIGVALVAVGLVIVSEGKMPIAGTAIALLGGLLCTFAL